MPASYTVSLYTISPEYVQPGFSKYMTVNESGDILYLLNNGFITLSHSRSYSASASVCVQLCKVSNLQSSEYSMTAFINRVPFDQFGISANRTDSGSAIKAKAKKKLRLFIAEVVFFQSFLVATYG